ARNSILPSALLAFFHASITKPSLTAVTAMVSTPLALIASAFCRKPGRWFLWQVGVKAPGTANSTTFLPLKTSSVVFQPGPSAVITLNLPSGTRSPTLIMMLPLVGGCLKIGRYLSVPDGLVETVGDLDRLLAGDRREGQRRAIRPGIGRKSIEFEGETLLAFGRASDRRGHGQRPVLCWPF